MADNYLGRKMEEYQNRPATHPQPHASLSRLLLKNRSHRGYDPNFIVREDQLRRIIAVNTRIPSARNQQVLRFRPVLSDEAQKVLPPTSGSEGPCRSFTCPCPAPSPMPLSSSARRSRRVPMSISIWESRRRACCCRRWRSD